MTQLVVTPDVKSAFIRHVKSIVTTTGSEIRVSATLGSPIPTDGQVQITQAATSGRRSLVTSNVSFIVNVWHKKEAEASNLARLIEAWFYALDSMGEITLYRKSSSGAVLQPTPDSGDFKKVSLTLNFDHSLEIKEV